MKEKVNEKKIKYVYFRKWLRGRIGYVILNSCFVVWCGYCDIIDFVFGCFNVIYKGRF